MVLLYLVSSENLKKHGRKLSQAILCFVSYFQSFLDMHAARYSPSCLEYVQTSASEKRLCVPTYFLYRINLWWNHEKEVGTKNVPYKRMGNTQWVIMWKKLCANMFLASWVTQNNLLILMIYKISLQRKTSLTAIIIWIKFSVKSIPAS